MAMALSLFDKGLSMEPQDSSETEKAKRERLVKELNNMRDAAVRLSLAMSDYQFQVEVQEESKLSKDAALLISKLKKTTSK